MSRPVFTISFTASRFNFSPPPPVVLSVLTARLPFADRYVTGACQGGDAWIGAWLHAARPEAEHMVVVPANRSQVDQWWARPERVLAVSQGRSPVVTVEWMAPGTGYDDRNQRLVDLADWVFGFPAFPEEDPRSKRSGTWQTIRMARDAKKLSQWHCVTPPYQGRIEGNPLSPVTAGGSPRTALRNLAFAAAGESRPRVTPPHQPRRGDDVEAWLTRWRGELAAQGSP